MRQPMHLLSRMYDSKVEFEELRTVDITDENGNAAKMVVGRLAEVPRSST